MIERFVDRTFRDLIKHHPERRFCWALGNNLFGQVLADCLTLTIRVSREVDGVGFFRSLLQLSNDLLVISFSGIWNYFVGRFEIIVDIDAQALARQIFDVAYRGLHQIVLPQIFVYGFRLRRRFYDY